MKTKSKLKLFVWTNHCTDWTPGLAFAIAEDETEARALIKKEGDGVSTIGDSSYLDHCNWGNLEIREITSKVARRVSGGG